MAKMRDTRTLDLLSDYRPEPVVERFDAAEIRAGTLAGKLSQAVARTLNEAGIDRAAVAKAMAEFLGAPVSKSTLDRYASQAAEEHSISAVRLIALIAVTNDARALNAILDGVGLIAVPKRFEALMRREAARLAKEAAEREEQAADAEWRARR